MIDGKGSLESVGAAGDVIWVERERFRAEGTLASRSEQQPGVGCLDQSSGSDFSQSRGSAGHHDGAQHREWSCFGHQASRDLGSGPEKAGMAAALGDSGEADLALNRIYIRAEISLLRGSCDSRGWRRSLGMIHRNQLANCDEFVSFCQQGI
jgi:hypothetical protein